MHLTARLCGSSLWFCEGSTPTCFTGYSKTQNEPGKSRRKCTAENVKCSSQRCSMRPFPSLKYHFLILVSLWFFFFSLSGTTNLPPQSDPKPWDKHPKACLGHRCLCNLPVCAICTQVLPLERASKWVRSCKKQPEMNCSVIRYKNVIQSWECV